MKIYLFICSTNKLPKLHVIGSKSAASKSKKGLRDNMMELKGPPESVNRNGNRNGLAETWPEGDSDKDCMCIGGMRRVGGATREGACTEGAWMEGAQAGEAQAGKAALRERMGALP